MLITLVDHLRFVVIDELHAFLDNVRGIHLRSLLARLVIATDTHPRKIGLSATIGDFAPARAFLCADAPANVRLLRDETQGKELRVGLKAYLDTPGVVGALTDVEMSEPRGGLSAVAADVAQRFRSGSNLVFCNSRRQTELLADGLRALANRERWPRNPFLLHHGSLSRDLRLETEQELKSGRPVTAICTSTLEMGIDLGAVRAVGQVGPPWSVASLVQRLGRSGRRDGEPQILRLYTLDQSVTQDSSLTDRLFPELVRAIALLDLHRERWLEPPEGERYHFSTCVHQILSVLRQTGGATAAHLHDVLCARGAFRKLTAGQLATLLRELAAQTIVEQIPTGELILAPAGALGWKSPPGVVLADEAYGGAFEWRLALRERGLFYCVRVPWTTTAWQEEPRFGEPAPVRRGFRAKRGPLLSPQPEHLLAIAQGLPASAWRTVTWRQGTKGPQRSCFASLPAWAAHGWKQGPQPERIEETVLIEWPVGEPAPTRYWLARLPKKKVAFARLVATAKARWRVEQDYRELKDELGLDHFEGRSWQGFHHHVALATAAFVFLRQEQTRLRRRAQKKPAPSHAAAGAPLAPGRAHPLKRSLPVVSRPLSPA